MDGTSATAGVFTAADVAVFSLTLAVSVGIGVYSSVRGGGSSTRQFMVGGNNMHPVPVALSLLGGILSAISILGNATEAYYFGTQISITLVGFILGTAFVCKFTIPIFYKLKITSLLEYLELRYRSRPLRQAITGALLINTCVYMSICLYAPCLALSTVTSLSTSASVLIMGSICTFYITIGGVRAVVYNDVPQTLLMFLGVLIVVVLVCKETVGAAEVWQVAGQGSRLEFFNFDPDPYVRHTFLSTLVHGVFVMLYWIGFSQAPHQRFKSVSTLPTAQGLCIFFCLGSWVLWLLYFFSGLVAYATYRHCDPLKAGLIKKPDQILPFLVNDKLRHFPGVAGLFVATVYGGVLSSLSSQANSAACLIWEDFLKNLPFFRRLSDSGATRIMKVLSAIVGALGTALGLLVGSLGSVVNVMNTLVSTIAGPYTGVFLAGIFLPWVNAKSAMVGFLVSLLYSVWMVVGKFLRGGGAPPFLPLSVQGCTNITTTFVNTTALLNSTSTISDTISTISDTTSSIFDTTNTIANIFSTTTSLLNTTNTIFNTTKSLLNLANITSHPSLLSAGIFTTAAAPLLDLPTSASPPQEDDDDPSVYDLSYCFSGVIGIIITAAVATIVSLVTGPTPPKGVCGRGLLNPTCERWYEKAWQLVKGGEMEDEEGEGRGVGEGVPMFSALTPPYTPSQ